MTTRNADVNLIIRARNEADRAIDSVATALQGLYGDAEHADTGVAELGKTLAALDKAAATVIGSVDKAGAALDRQTSNITENRAALAALVAQQSEARQILASFGDQANKAFVGPRTEGFTKTYAAVRAEADRLEVAIKRTSGTIAQQESAVAGAQSSLLKLSLTSGAIAEAQTVAEARISLTTQALNDQAAAATRVTEVQRRINALTGVDRPASTGSAAAVADILAAADAEFRLAEARAAQIQKLREEEAATAALAVATERNQRFSRSQGIAADPRGSQARASAGVFEEAFRVEDAQKLRDAEHAYELFNARVAAGVVALKAEAEAQKEVDAGTLAAAKRNAAAAYELFERKVRDGVAAMRDADEAERRMVADAQNLRDKLDPLAAIQRKLNEELVTYRRLLGAGKIDANELAAAEKHLAEEAARAGAALDSNGKPKLSLFGLKPYELQNLGYQVNDVVTQLASGTSLSQTLAQQGGQILQLFPKVGGAIVGAFGNPVVLGFLVSIGAIALGIKRAADESERLRKINATLDFRADGGTYDAKALAEQEWQLVRTGVAAKDAEGAIKSFLDHSVAPDRIAEFSRAARATAEVLGTELPDAANQVAEAFTGGYAAIAKFDDKLNFLTASERENIRTLFEEGRAGEARTEALRIYTAKQDEAATKSRGSWAGATRELGGAVSDLLELFSRSAPIQAFTDALTNLAAAARNAIGDIRKVGDLSGTLQEIADKRAFIARLDAQIAANPNASDIGATRLSRDDAQRGLATLVTRYNDLAKAAGAAQVAADGTLKAVAKTDGDTVAGGGNSVAAKDRADRLREISIEDTLQRLRDAGQSRILTAAEQARRAELAGQVAARTASDAVVAAAERRRAVAHETAQIDKETDARAKASAADREQEIKSYLNAVVAAEGTGKNRAGSSAVGAGQFLRGTFVNLYKQINPNTALHDDQIAALRNDSKTALEVLEVFTRQNAGLIQRAGKQVNGANLYLLHFLGTGTGVAALKASPDTPIDQVIRSSDPRHAEQVLAQNAGYLRTEKGKGPPRTVAQLQTYLGAKVSNDPGSRAQTRLIANESDLLTQAEDNQNKLNLAIQHGNEDRARSIDGLTKEAGLYGTALLAEQKRQAVVQAELDLRQRVEDQNRSLKPGESSAVVTAEQVAALKEQTAAIFDLQHAREAASARQADAQRPVDDLEAQRDLLRQQAEFLRSIGDNSSADDVDKQIVGLTGSIEAAYDALIKFYEALNKEDRKNLNILDQGQFDNIIKGLKHAKDDAQDMGRTFGILNTQIRDTFSGALASSLTSFITKVASGKNVFKSLGQSVREFAATFISAIAQILVQMVAYAATVTLLRALGVPIPNFSFGSHHTGGTVGQGGAKRTVNPGVFAGAMRFHTGGIIGLKPNERAIIAEDGEEVLTSRDPRHRANGGLGGGGSGRSASFKFVNLFDKEEAAQQLITTKSGEKAILNLVRTNPRAFKAALEG